MSQVVYTNQSISAQAEIFGAGNAGLPDGSGQMPRVFSLPANPAVLTMLSVTGNITIWSGNEANDADGVLTSGSFNGPVINGITASVAGAYGGISGITMPGCGALVGVFAPAIAPTGAAPASLDFTVIGTGFTNLAPQLYQTFYIGDGLTSDGSGRLQQFIVPAGATRLFLGISDAENFNGPPGGYSDNSGAFTASFQITSLPQLTQDLANIYVQYGQNTSVGVSVSSQTPVSYQWYFLPANNAGQAGAYAVTFNGFVVGAVVTNAGFGYGNMPHVGFVGGGGSGASGMGTNLNGVITGIGVTNAGSGYAGLPTVVIDPPNGFLFGQTNSTLTISNAGQNSLGNYYVVVSNSSGSTTSSMVNLTLLYPPAITNKPQDQVVNAYSTAAFAVGASGTAPLSYQWLYHGSILPGAVGSGLTFSSVTPPDLGPYSVIVTNNYGSVTSSVANLNMFPYLKTPFTGLQTFWGQTNVLSVGTWGSGDLAYQWYFNGVAIPDATSSNLVLSSIQFTNAGLYSVVVSSPYGSVTNSPETVVVNPANTAIEFCANVVIQGTVGYAYTIESTTNLSDPNSWVVETNLTLTQPIEFWDDTSVDVRKHPQNYYRVLPGQ